jgi:hypothetical protein
MKIMTAEYNTCSLKAGLSHYAALIIKWSGAFATWYLMYFITDSDELVF